MNWFKNLLLANLKVGAVLHQFCEFTTPPKYKYLVVASVSPRLLVLLINTEINPFYYKKGLDHLHMSLSGTKYNFLNHDSYLDCTEAFENFTKGDIEKAIDKNYRDVKRGDLDNDGLNVLLETIKTSPVIETRMKKEIISSLEEEIN